MLKSHQSQLKTLISDREFSKISTFNTNIGAAGHGFLRPYNAQMNDELAETRLFEYAKIAILFGFNESEALCYKMQLGFCGLLMPTNFSIVSIQGYGSFLLRDLPFDAIQFCIYEQLRIGYRVAAKRELSDQEIAMVGAFAGVITGAITTPLDVLKTRLMTQGSTKQYSGLLSCTQTIMREEGPAALLKGIGPRILWIGIGGSIFFGVLEKSRALLEQQYSSLNLKSDSLKQQ